MGDKIHCWDGNKFFECMKGTEEKFRAKVEWDTDYYSPGEGCHGKDFFTQGDTVNIDFSKFGDGSIVARIDYKDEFVVLPDNQLYKMAEVNLVPVDVISRQPALFSLTRPSEMPRVDYFAGSSVSADQAFLDCYKDSQNLNPNLTDPQKAVVERFFAVVKAAFPEAFAGKTKAKAPVANTPRSTNFPFGYSRFQR